MKPFFVTIGVVALGAFGLWGITAAGDLIRQRDDWAVLQGYLILAAMLGGALSLTIWTVKKVFGGPKGPSMEEKVSVRKEGDKWISS